MKSRSKARVRRKDLPVLIGGGLGVIIISLVVLYSYFGTHFFPGTTINQIAVGGLSTKAAQQKLAKNFHTLHVTLNSPQGKTSLTLNEPYELSGDYLKQQVRKQKIQLPLKDTASQMIEQAVTAAALPKEVAGKNARVVYRKQKFMIVPEKIGTQVNRKALAERLSQDLATGNLKAEYALADFYQAPPVTKKSLTQQQVIPKLNQLAARKVSVKVAAKKIPLTKKQLAALLNEEGKFDQTKVEAWFAQLNQKYATINQPVRFTNIHGQTLQYKNVGNYGWYIDSAQSAAQLVKKLANRPPQQITAVLHGDPKKQPLNVKKDYVEVDLDQQKMYCFHNGKKVVSTPVITGRYTKGTATVPGFHTIMDKKRNVALSGRLIDGDGSYSVPVKYWMPLLSYGQTITEIGLHDTDYKLKYFGEKNAYKTNLGSYGCVNTPGKKVAQIYHYAYIGMPVFIYGQTYDDAPGEFDKPMEHGVLLNKNKTNH
ncbi:L,D-transpeptidase family protein [Enterococcus sp. CSURQ0835]|uniref:L,D-transpeptidase family protein n=1 Tax=Enterococcus sp. CSURQ0835 TaxID=2681394 RepID=UPI001F3FA05A|nr:L,D-transpeptidase family protein [Enterococcus sp. CSURQ0835]